MQIQYVECLLSGIIGTASPFKNKGCQEKKEVPSDLGQEEFGGFCGKVGRVWC